MAFCCKPVHQILYGKYRPEFASVNQTAFQNDFTYLLPVSAGFYHDVTVVVTDEQFRY